MEKQSFYFNQFEFDQALTIYQQNAKTWNRISKAYIALNIGQFSKEVLLGLASGDEKTVKQIKESFNGAIEKNLNVMKIKLNSLRQKLIEYSQKEFNDFMETLNTGLNEISQNQPIGFSIPVKNEHLSVTVSGEVVLDDECVSKIKNDFSLFIETEEQKQFVELAEAVANSSKAFIEFLKKLPAHEYTLDMTFFQNSPYFVFKGDSIEFRKSSLSYFCNPPQRVNLMD
ncbi:MAG: hypothetical protein AB7E36_14865 [Salinivirgaceae bacterium]